MPQNYENLADREKDIMILIKGYLLLNKYYINS